MSPSGSFPNSSLCPFLAFPSRVCLIGRNRLGPNTARQCSLATPFLLGEAGKALLICVIQGREYLWPPWPGDCSCFLFPVSEEAYLFRGTLRGMCVSPTGALGVFPNQVHAAQQASC